MGALPERGTTQPLSQQLLFQKDGGDRPSELRLTENSQLLTIRSLEPLIFGETQFGVG